MTREHCPVCAGPTTFHTQKDFQGDCGLDMVVYTRCEACGFVFSPTLYALDEDAFTAVNAQFHGSLRQDQHFPDDPHWAARLTAQAGQIVRLRAEGVLPADRPWLDYGCGNGALITRLQALGITGAVGYEPYMDSTVKPAVTLVDDAALIPGAFDCVIATSFFEHVRDLRIIDRVCGLVSPAGALVFHTFVDVRIPTDPGWFYFLPVHASFFTEGALRVLFARHGFRSAAHVQPGNLHVWSRADVPGFVPGEPAPYQAVSD